MHLLQRDSMACEERLLCRLERYLQLPGSHLPHGSERCLYYLWCALPDLGLILSVPLNWVYLLHHMITTMTTFRTRFRYLAIVTSVQVPSHARLEPQEPTKFQIRHEVMVEFAGVDQAQHDASVADANNYL
jgi:hypothetical protein